MEPDSAQGLDIRLVTPAARVSSAARLVSGPEGAPAAVGTAFLRRATANSLEIDHFWAVFDGGGRARQSVLLVPQPGRTAMIFVSADGPAGLCGDAETQHEERVALLRRVFGEAAGAFGDRVRLLQALPSPEEGWASSAFSAAGMSRLGELLYLRRPLSMPRSVTSPAPWPEGVEVMPLRGLEAHRDGPALREALERTYIDTLDCPGLCDLRETPDVIESHRAAGRFDPSLWWIVWHRGRPEGCVLLSPSPEQDCVELVYIGLGPELRGRGLGRTLLEMAISRVQRSGLSMMNCAVDARNEPARAVYSRLGFTPFAERVAFVRPVGAC